ncbi:hypothetical protein [Congzhengia minquanensis]|uniref:SLH domain-containing protein n=1 Tax=Congzhengia minquanensis TaxID=2763657 RepID=A0A926DQD8_9FIRM|nr:hypothetical protein [Congzhengia minquanensis]MBC8541912.1 hypothetical protein [Congzhengia minquanensis]
MERIISIALLVICLLGMNTVYADSDISVERDMLTELNIIDESYLSNSNTVTRAECIVAITRVIGVTNEDIEKLNGADFVAFEDTDSYSYFGCAYRAKIAYGEECIVDYPTYRTSHTGKNTDFFFFPNRAATVKETLAFMVRCLQSDKTDFDLILEKAKDNGLINDKDDFIQNLNDFISQDNFFVLLERLLQQKRYKYYDRENNRFKMEGNIDEERCMTYLEFLTQRQMAEQ